MPPYVPPPPTHLLLLTNSRVVAENPANLTDEERTQLEITQKLPGSLSEALEELKADRELREALGADLMDKYLTFKHSERTAMEGIEHNRCYSARFNWEVERY